MTQSDRSSRAQAEIDANLKRAYEELSQQDVPDRFKNLLAQLRAADQGRAPGGSGGQP